jgi:allophanate hydrolase
MPPLAYSLDRSRLAAAYDSGTLTPCRVVADLHAEIESSRDANPAWIHVVPRDRLLEQAKRLERRRAQGESLPLYGIPFGVKDNIDVAECPTTAGCPAYSYIPARSAHAVQRLLAAGAICMGKTNLDQFATGLVGTRSPYGACVNPFDPRRIAGGSSSGSAVAVALGQVSFALGTDTAGSGRVPAAFCNIVGFKPTHGIVSTSGVVPACRSLDCVSVLALTCEDARAVFDAMRGFDPEDIYSRRGTPRFRPPLAQRFRCGVPRAAQLEFFGDEAAREAFAQVMHSLRRIGAEIVEIDYTPYASAGQLLYDGPWIAERLAAIKDFFRESSSEIHPVTREILGSARKYTALDAFEAGYRLQQLRHRCAVAWDIVDVIAVPTAGTLPTLSAVAAAPIALNANLGYYTNFVNLLDLAAIAVPGGFRSDGLPAGVTLIAPALSDMALLDLGARLHRACGMPLGATAFELPRRGDDTQAAPAADADDEVVIAVVGAHLSGLALNHQLTSRGARLVGPALTAPCYRLYALPGTHPPRPGLLRTHDGSGTAVEIELWRLPVERLGGFIAEVPAPLGIGTVLLADGREVKGFLCEPYALREAKEVSSYGGWRRYLASQTPPPAAAPDAATADGRRRDGQGNPDNSDKAAA